MNKEIKKQLEMAEATLSDAASEFSKKSSHYEFLERSRLRIIYIGKKQELWATWTVEMWTEVLANAGGEILSVSLHFSNSSYMKKKLEKAMHAINCIGKIVGLVEPEEENDLQNALRGVGKSQRRKRMEEDLNKWARNNGEPMRPRGALRLAMLERGENPDSYNDDWIDPDNDDRENEDFDWEDDNNGD